MLLEIDKNRSPYEFFVGPYTALHMRGDKLPRKTKKALANYVAYFLPMGRRKRLVDRAIRRILGV